MLVGVGGQGTITASKLLTNVLMDAGHDVKMSEIHGMSQRGGSVSSQIRYGENVACPVIELGSADLLVAFEKLEGLRNLAYLKTDGAVVVNDFRIDPVGVLAQTAEYPPNVIERIARCVDTTVVAAYDLALEAGEAMTMNVVLLGALAKRMEMAPDEWEDAIKKNIKPNYVDVNLRAFHLGYTN
ncbi:MAG: indolepyruvate oxidoreductase subunit beta [Eubacteriaceae bacterium]|nr:indolepyruvate oxidoreductase subunit beta [Eubacteriaceae bacterium]